MVDDLLKAEKALKHGKLIVYPTDTLYALGADIFNKDAVEKVFEIKKRPWDVPLPVAVSDVEQIQQVADVNDTARIFSKVFLPGPLTLVLFKKKLVPDIVTAGMDKIAVRIPKNDLALRLISNFGPLTVTSCNIHGRKTAEVISKIKMQFTPDDISVFLDQGELKGKPSTIVDISEGNIKILRKGGISKKQIMDVKKKYESRDL